ncbi:MAG: hypothetical protein DRQ39_11505 [Gammaproteobacteria bacterium]|nr:MAG: hypothetical protein DRQ39_11505 [Gammaproteobacteria bacterium]
MAARSEDPSIDEIAMHIASAVISNPRDSSDFERRAGRRGISIEAYIAERSYDVAEALIDEGDKH